MFVVDFDWVVVFELVVEGDVVVVGVCVDKDLMVVFGFMEV